MKYFTSREIGLNTIDILRTKVSPEQFHKAQKVKWPKNICILGSSLKIEKGEKDKILSSIIYMSPEKESVPYGGKNLCPMASLGCAAACLGSKSARLKMSNGFNSKLWKSLLYTYNRSAFKALLFDDIVRHEKKAKNKGYKCAVRLNGCTDILFEHDMPDLFEQFPNVQFYDYTKVPSRFKSPLPNNYHLTFSRSESNQNHVDKILEDGYNVAIVFEDLNKAIKTGYNSYKVINGDETDYRPSDPNNVVIGLGIKANVKDNTGFIINNA